MPTDIPSHGQFIDPNNLKTQQNVDEINKWTLEKKMSINTSKTKNMIFNFTNNKFTTRVKLNDQNLEVISQVKLLGTIITDDLKWDVNTSEIIRKAYARMTLLAKIAEFNPPVEDLKVIYILFI